MTSRILFAALTVAVSVCAPAMAAVGDGFIGALAADRTTVWAGLNTSELVRLDPGTGEVRSRTPTPAALDDLAIGPEGVWGIATCGGRTCAYGVLMHFDRAGRLIRPLTRLGANPRAIALGGGAVWVLADRRLSRFDPGTGQPATSGPRSIAVGRNTQDVAFGAGRVWVTTGRAAGSSGPCRLAGVDATSGQVEVTRTVPCVPRAVAYGFGRAWTTGSPRLPRSSVDLVAGSGRVWVAEVRRERAGGAVAATAVAHVTGIDPDDGTSIGTAVAATPSWVPRIAVGAGGVWLANAPLGTIASIDPVTGRLIGNLRPGRE